MELVEQVTASIKRSVLVHSGTTIDHHQHTTIADTL
jgi:hypothetical protein